jgi:predicted PurR-regulated permease PerM
MGAGSGPGASIAESEGRFGQAGAVTSIEQPAAGPRAGAGTSPPRYPGPTLRVAGDYAWRLLILGTVGYFALRLLSHLALAVIPFLVSLLVTALLRPILNFFRRLGLSRGPSTLATMVVAAVVIGGVISLVVIRAAEQAPQLGNEINSLIPQIKHWLITGPLRLNPTTVNNLGQTLTNDVTKNSSAIASTALSTGKTALQVLGGIALVVFSTVFLLYDGERVWQYLIKGAPAPARPRVDAGGRAAWQTLSHYVRGTLVVAAFHGIVIAITLTILGVPLAFPLAVLVGLGGFVPLVGAFVTGALAVGVAGLSKGLVAAIIVVAVLVLDNQIEAHALQPFVVGRYVRIHPLAVVLALAAGALLFGIFGAIVAVPVVACINSAIRAAIADEPDGPAPAAGEVDPPSEGGSIPSRGG